MNCPIDANLMNYKFSGTVMGEYHAEYYQCPECLLLQPENPERWLQKAYSSAIAESDIGLIFRNQTNASLTTAILHFLNPAGSRILDVGGGFGVLCRSLRDRGFDCYTTDIYCENLFARSFEPWEGFEANCLLAFEVFEHVPDPLEFVSSSFSRYNSNYMIFSTLTHNDSEPPPRDWWYYTFETGQHISLYHRRSLMAIAEKLGFHYFRISDNLHIYSRQELPMIKKALLGGALRNKVSCRILTASINHFRQRLSLLDSDYKAIRKKMLSSGNREED